jgi:phosphatidylglycerol---prolipoprotein diacylglyceryl transferase
MQIPFPHAGFDILAYVISGLTLVWVEKRLPPTPGVGPKNIDYYLALVGGAAIGSYLFGTLNLLLSHHDGIGRSIEGALAGAILGVEIYKYKLGVSGSTGARFALPFAVGVGIGRIGCYLSGLDDFTYGIPTTMTSGRDFGDGVLRHPVQLYESAAMFLFASAYLIALGMANKWFIRNGFYLVVGYYGLQRFVFEFLKPYGTLGPFTVFQILSLGLMAYAIIMLRRSDARETANA